MKVYSEVEGAAALLGYSTINAGCCKVCARWRCRRQPTRSQADIAYLQVMIHPTFGTKVRCCCCWVSLCSSLLLTGSRCAGLPSQLVCKGARGWARGSGGSAGASVAAAARVVLTPGVDCIQG